MLKCYVGGSKDPWEYSHVDACFANDAKQAKKLMWKRGRLSEECEGDWLDARVVRAPEHDKLLDHEADMPYVVRSPNILRNMGWKMEDEYICDSCGLAPMGIEKFEVCNDCGMCADCAADDDEKCECKSQ